MLAFKVTFFTIRETCGQIALIKILTLGIGTRACCDTLLLQFHRIELVERLGKQCGVGCRAHVSGRNGHGK